MKVKEEKGAGTSAAALDVFLLFWDLGLPRVALGALTLQVRALCNAPYCVIVGYTWSGRRVLAGGPRGGALSLPLSLSLSLLLHRTSAASAASGMRRSSHSHSHCTTPPLLFFHLSIPNCFKLILTNLQLSPAKRIR